MTKNDKWRCQLEKVLDTLCEANNGATAEALNQAYLDLLEFRDKHYNIARVDLASAKEVFGNIVACAEDGVFGDEFEECPTCTQDLHCVICDAREEINRDHWQDLRRAKK